ncbi:glutathione-dependent disulfide-bond oxidoreductase [Altericroceibacterium endophyticum]|uniref:Glutathione-dependent disulfide-bond oxidoreductase n=1 Tax=Altericroceibacterium endophyticum TaxID=1808508 RepID=A0A6I4T9X9_9SPHN|nr:glutathione-dependent disulfide-bond oxidoreductase [Altericroceibacterium endophyticum]MXO66823.1 glutathione-dependent disulfide-bond oxidoreductase [Altericroceibacterium endophyticum]
MADDTYTPPKVWEFDPENGGQFAGINRPTAGPREDKELPLGEHPFQLYSLGTPNGVKTTIMFEELLEAGYAAEYDAWMIKIFNGDQFGSGFVDLNPNSKIPALLDRSGPTPFRVFESGAILMHLAEKFDYLLPKENPARAETISWLMWQMGSAPAIGGGFGHFYNYAPERYKYPIDRYSMETKRLFDVADRQLAQTRFLAGDDYTIADIASYTWLGNLYRGEAYGNAAEFLSLHEYENVGRWVGEIDARPAARRGKLVNSQKGLDERHSASDFEKLPKELLEGVTKGF